MPPDDAHRVEIHLDELVAARGMTLTTLADQVGLTLANLSILKNGRARAIRFTNCCCSGANDSQNASRS